MHIDRSGLAAGLLAYSLWGLYPFYFKALSDVSAFEILGHRIVWSLVTLALFLPFGSGWSDVVRVFRTPRLLGGLVLSALIISSNWLVYMIAVQSGHVLEASLSYFLSPLVFILLALIVLRERLRRLQWIAVVIAALGVGWMIVHAGVVPKIALFVGISFSVYGLVRKRLAVGPVAGLFLECLFASPLALILFWYVQRSGGVVFPSAHAGTVLMLVLSGVITVGPLWLFNVATKRLPLVTIGMLQYLTPTILFFLSVLVFLEPIDTGRVLGFIAIWLALGFYTADAIQRPHMTANAGK